MELEQEEEDMELEQVLEVGMEEGAPDILHIYDALVV
jgi:hypothetical protein